jgi:hypothetical protein
MKWVLFVLAINGSNPDKPYWYSVPGWPSKAACEEAAKQYGRFNANCYPDAQTLPKPPAEESKPVKKLTDKEIKDINRDNIKLLGRTP